MDNIAKYIQQGFNIFIFCIAITFLFTCFNTYNNILYTAKEIKKNDVIYEKYSDSGEAVVDKAELIVTLFSQLEYDIEIDGSLFSKKENLKESIYTFPIDHKKYLKSYKYDNNGNVTRIIYKGM